MLCLRTSQRRCVGSSKVNMCSVLSVGNGPVILMHRPNEDCFGFAGLTSAIRHRYSKGVCGFPHGLASVCGESLVKPICFTHV
eukprot:m.118859 g.118859  ORF g.118859 m.118859 type:complete len:83 (-) comp13264_c0_seq1:3423-3671(-)